MYYSFNNVDRDYSEAQLSEEAQYLIATLPKDYATTQINAIENALRGDFSALNAIRAQRNLSTEDLSSVDVCDKWIESDYNLRLRIYTPHTNLSQSRNILLYIHGGGWTINSPENCERFCRDFAVVNDAIVVAPDYRLAPEHKYPAANKDVKIAFDWVVKHSRLIGGSPNKIFIAGDSAGGHLAISLALDIRDNSTNYIQPQGVIAFYPATDLCNNYSRKSFKTFSEGYCLNGELMKLFVKSYVPTYADAQQATLLGKNFKGFPRTLIIVSECDVLRDEATELYYEMTKAEVPVRFVCFKGATHVFITQKAMDNAYRNALEEISAFLTRTK